MAYFLRNGNTFRVSSKEAMDLHEKLPVGNYIIKEDQFGNLFLEMIDSFEFKGKRYGDNTKNTDRIINTYMDREVSTGVMLTGEKGSGKTLLAKSLSMKGYELEIPTIVINAAWVGDKFNKFLQDIDQPTIILFDEFEKVYDSDEQESILTLLDGVFPSKKLFVLTCNDKWRVDQHMRNRPGRIYYMLDFKGLATEFIIEYCKDNLKNKDHIDKICNIASLFHQFNFDMLKALVEEMNRYNETPEDALTMLNAKPEFDEGNRFTVDLAIANKVIDKEKLDEREWKGNPLQQPVKLEYLVTEKDKDGDEYQDWESIRFTAVDLQKIDPNSGKFVFVNKDGARLTLTKAKEKTYSYYDML